MTTALRRLMAETRRQTLPESAMARARSWSAAWGFVLERKPARSDLFLKRAAHDPTFGGAYGFRCTS